MDLLQIASFVVRFQLAAVEKDTGNKHWRIKVTHVQDERETLFESMDEAFAYLKEVAEES